MQGQVVAALPGCFSPDFASIANQSLISFLVYQYTIQDTLSASWQSRQSTWMCVGASGSGKGLPPWLACQTLVHSHGMAWAHDAENRALLVVVLGTILTKSRHFPNSKRELEGIQGH